MLYYIYKILCRDTAVKHCYVGSTTNLFKRANKHKNCCKNESGKRYNLKLYCVIRENGGWDNWQLICIAEIDADNKREAFIKEEEYRIELQADMNSLRCYRTAEEKTDSNKERCNKWYEANKEKIKNYYEDNKAKIKEQHHKYYEDNKEKFDCGCGGKFTNAHKTHHFKTKKHQSFLESQKNTEIDTEIKN